MILILGAKGMLGGALQKVFPDALAWDREEADVTRLQDLRFKIEDLEIKPTAIINCVAFNDVDGAEEKQDAAYLLNTEAPGNLAALCKDLSVPFVHFSTNYVFDGNAGEYQETDIPSPLSIYGQSKFLGEQAIVEKGGQFYIIRTSVLFGPKGESDLSKKSFIDSMLDLSTKSDTIKVVEDEFFAITYVHDLAGAVQSLLLTMPKPGIYHLVNSGVTSWYDLAKEIFSIMHKDIIIIPVSSSEFPRKAERPKKAVLLNTKLSLLRSWQSALKEFLAP